VATKRLAVIAVQLQGFIEANSRRLTHPGYLSKQIRAKAIPAATENSLGYRQLSDGIGSGRADKNGRFEAQASRRRQESHAGDPPVVITISCDSRTVFLD
jgi:hypothetical protein